MDVLITIIEYIYFNNIIIFFLKLKKCYLLFTFVIKNEKKKSYIIEIYIYR